MWVMLDTTAGNANQGRIIQLGYSEVAPADTNQAYVWIPTAVKANPSPDDLVTYSEVQGVQTASAVTAAAALIIPTQAQIKAHTNRAVDLMQASWVLPTVIPSTGNQVLVNTRWRNTRYWIGSLHAVVSAVVAAAAGVTDAQKAFAWSAYQSLVPLDAERIAFWYRNHSDSYWAVYSDVGAAAVVAWVGFNLASTTVPTFASDASAAIQWAGSLNSNTLAVNVPQNWREA